MRAREVVCVCVCARARARARVCAFVSVSIAQTPLACGKSVHVQILLLLTAATVIHDSDPIFRARGVVPGPPPPPGILSSRGPQCTAAVH